MGLGILGDEMPQAMANLDARVRKILAKTETADEDALPLLREFRDLEHAFQMTVMPSP